MGKATIIEAQNSNATFEQGTTQKGILGKLKGIFADYKHGTRNADRLYTEELWDNRVFGSEDVMEALRTKTLFGELDHPDGDRCETLAKNAAITITKLEKKPEEGVIYGEAEILDTPTGRIVKALADSGAKLGISSRGMGEEIYVDGQNIIDPDTYDFITFDVVVTPANEKARVALTESKHKTALTESLKEAVGNCETENQLNQLKSVAENINDTESLDLINNKLNKVTETVTQQINLTESNQKVAMNILNKRYKEMAIQLEESKTAIDSLKEENETLIKDKEFLSESRTMLQSKLKESKTGYIESEDKIRECIRENIQLKKNTANLEKEVKTLTESNTTANKTNKELKEENKTLKAQLKESITLKNEQELKKVESIANVKQIYDKKIESLKLTCNDEAQKIMTQLDEAQQENTKLQESMNNMKTKLNESNKIVESLNKEINQLKQTQAQKLTESKKVEEAKIKQIKSLTEQNEKLQNQIKELTESNKRYSELPFNSMGTIKVKPENFAEQKLTLEEQQLFDALTNM